MFDNLTVDDIIRIYSETMLDEAIRGRPANPLERYARLVIEDRLKRPLSSIDCT